MTAVQTSPTLSDLAWLVDEDTFAGSRARGWPCRCRGRRGA